MTDTIGDATVKLATDWPGQYYSSRRLPLFNVLTTDAKNAFETFTHCHVHARHLSTHVAVQIDAARPPGSTCVALPG